MGYQVFDVTHDSNGSSLPANKKPFISFSYGERNIEDFNLIVTFMDRYNRNVYSNIKNTTTTYQGVHGQMFWEYSYEANLYTFTLSTDGMTYEELEDFKNYFIPGVYKDLILAETSNRKALARISTTPQMNMLPFEEKKVFKVDNEDIEISTTLFKGDISIEFCLDYPFWSAINSYYDSVTEDNAKNIFEDKVPTKEMLKTSMFLGNNKYYNGTDIVDDFSVAATKNTPIYLYYCGTSNGHPEITMTIQPTIGEDGFISEPGNSYTGQYPYLEIDGNKFYYTTPNLLTSYNKTIEIVSKYNSGDSIIELRKELRELIKTNENTNIELLEENEQIILIAHGMASHAAHPDLGVNAISMLLLLLEKIFENYNIKTELLKTFSELIGMQHDGKDLGMACEDESGKLTVNVGNISFENNCIKIGMNLRIPVTVKIKEIEEKFEKLENSNIRVFFEGQKEPLYIDKDNYLVKTLCETFNEVTGQNAEPIAIGGATYARAFQNCVSFGANMPGEKDMCHQVDECISIQNLHDACQIYAEAIYKLTR